MRFIPLWSLSLWQLHYLCAIENIQRSDIKYWPKAKPLYLQPHLPCPGNVLTSTSNLSCSKRKAINITLKTEPTMGSRPILICTGSLLKAVSRTCAVQYNTTVFDYAFLPRFQLLSERFSGSLNPLHSIHSASVSTMICPHTCRTHVNCVQCSFQ